MTIAQAEKKIRNAWIASVIVGLINLLLVFTTSVWFLIDVFLMIVFTFGIYKKSRVAAIGMFIYFLVSRLVWWAAVLSAVLSAGYSILPWILIGGALLYFFFEGARGAIIYHQLRAGKGPLASPPASYVYPMSVARLRKRAWLMVLLVGVVVAAVIVGSAMIFYLSSGPYVGGCVARGRGRRDAAEPDCGCTPRRSVPTPSCQSDQSCRYHRGNPARQNRSPPPADSVC